MKESISLQEIQEEVDKWISQHGGYWPPLSMLCAVMEELGEVAREINSLEGFKPKKSNSQEVKIGEELADILFSIICIANHYQISLSDEYNKIIQKYTKRDSDRF